jgi:hypothetical protein
VTRLCPSVHYNHTPQRTWQPPVHPAMFLCLCHSHDNGAAENDDTIHNDAHDDIIDLQSGRVLARGIIALLCGMTGMEH